MAVRAIFLLLALSATAVAQERYLVRGPEAAIRAVAARHGAVVLRTLEVRGRHLHVVLTPPGPAGAAAVRGLAADPQVGGLEPDRPIGMPETSPIPMGLTFDPVRAALGDRSVVDYYGTPVWGAYANQPAVRLTNLWLAHTFADGAGTVAVLDSGADFSHPVLAGSLVPGYDFTRGGGIGSELADLDQSTTAILDQSTTAILDKNTVFILNQSTTAILDQSTTAILDRLRSRLPSAFGHGTMVAGLVHLAAPKARIMPVKVFQGNGVGQLSDIVAGIYWAVDQGARVINMSFSSTETSAELHKAVQYATARRVVCIASVGNGGQRASLYPAALPDVLGIASVGRNGQRSTFSNYGPAVTLAAPGEGNITLFPGKGYAAVWGTSFSTPLVAGTASLLLDLSPNLTRAQAEQSLRQAVYAGPELGAGRLDAFLACLHRALRRDE